MCCFRGVSADGCGVIVEGSAPITGDAVATPPVGDSKVSNVFPFSYALRIGSI